MQTPSSPRLADSIPAGRSVWGPTLSENCRFDASIFNIIHNITFCKILHLPTTLADKNNYDILTLNLLIEPFPKVYYLNKLSRFKIRFSFKHLKLTPVTWVLHF